MKRKTPTTGIMPPKQAAITLARKIEQEQKEKAAAFVAFKKLRTRIDALTTNPELTRASVLGLLESIYETLSPLYCVEVKDKSESNQVETIESIDHPAFKMLLNLIDDIKNLNNDKTPTDKKSSSKKGRSLEVNEKRKDQALINGVYILQRTKKMKNRSRAESDLANILVKKGYKIRGKRPTKSRIKAIIDRENKALNESLEHYEGLGSQKRKRGRPRVK